MVVTPSSLVKNSVSSSSSVLNIIAYDLLNVIQKVIHILLLLSWLWLS